METMTKDGFTTINPANANEIKGYELMTQEEADQAVKKWHEAFLKWRHRPMEERGKIIKKIGSVLQERKKEFTALMTEEMGKLLKHGEQEIELCSGICEYTAGNGLNLGQ